MYNFGALFLGFYIGGVVLAIIADIVSNYRLHHTYGVKKIKTPFSLRALGFLATLIRILFPIFNYIYALVLLFNEGHMAKVAAKTKMQIASLEESGYIKDGVFSIKKKKAADKEQMSAMWKR